MKTRITGALSTVACALMLSVAVPSDAQEKIGVVTTVVGPVTVARASLPPEPLKFKDAVFLHDRVTTGEDAITRILLGGKVIVTARERSTLTITEVPGLSTIHLASGRIAVAVEKSKMNPGERVDIRTPNAVAGVRGTVLVVEAEAGVSTVTVLRGLVHVTRLNPTSGVPVGALTAVGARQAVIVRNNVLPSRPRSITPARANELAQEFTPPLKPMPTTAAVAAAEDLKQDGVVAKLDAGSGSDVDKLTPAIPTGTTTTRPGTSAATTGAPAAPAASAPAIGPIVATPPAPVLAATPTAPSTSPLAAAPAPPSVPAMPVATPPAPAPAPVVKPTSSKHGPSPHSWSPNRGKGSSTP